MKKVISTAIFMVVLLCISIQANAQINIHTDLVVLDIGQVYPGQVVDAEIPIGTIIPNEVINAEAEVGWEGTNQNQYVGVAVGRRTIDVRGLLVPEYAPEGPIKGTLSIKINAINLLGLPIYYILELPIEGEVIL